MSKALENMTREELLQAAKNLESEKQKLESKAEKLESKAEYLQFRIDQLNRLLFGAKRERFISSQTHGQMSLPFDLPDEEPEYEETEVPSHKRRNKKRENHPGRLPLPDHLPVEETVLEPEEDTTGMKCIGKEVTDQLEYDPGKLFIKRIIRPKYIKDVDQETEKCAGVIAELPDFPIEKGIAGLGLLAQIMINKFVDHLPIYRQIEMFKREGVKIPSSTINGWQESVCTLLSPLYETLRHRVLSQGYLQVDETPLPVLDKSKKGKTHQGYHWVYHSPLENTILVDYRHGRSREGPKILLKDYKGYLQTDGYKVYDIFAKNPDITHLNCMAHARRGFEQALDYDKTRAEYAMGSFQKLYAIERLAKEENMTPDQRKELRLDKALPILNEFGKWIVETYKTSLPKSPMGKATAYCIPRWDNLIGYLYDGHLEIDNNLVENAIRPIALGRKNYLFAGSQRGAERAAMFYSFFGTCKKNIVNPFEWLKSTLERIPSHKANKLHELLPQNFTSPIC